MKTEFWWENLKKNRLENLFVVVRIILKCILREQDGR
jgi:hypothetical protein